MEEFTAEELAEFSRFVTDNFQFCADIDTHTVTELLAKCIGITQTLNAGKTVDDVVNPPVVLPLGMLMCMVVEILYRRREDAARHN